MRTMDDDTLEKRMVPNATDLAKLGSGRSELERALENIAATQNAVSLLERYAETIRPNSKMVELGRQLAEAEKFRKQALFADSIHVSIAATAEKYLADMRASSLALQDRMAKQLLDIRLPAFDLAKYEVPKLAALDFKLADFSAAGAIAKFLDGETRNQLHLSKIAAALTAPWARIADPLLSAKALVEVHSLGAALRNGHAFEEAFSTALRADLGDWREPVVFDPDALLDSARRTALYVERGFERSLTDFPEPVYAETLEVAGIAPNYLLINLEQLVPPPASPEDAAQYQRASFCYSVLLRLEKALRNFIQVNMTRQYGSAWPKRMQGMYDRWQEKAEIARAQGRTFDTLIDMADFTDYETIISRRDHFKDVFSAFFPRSEFAGESLRRLYPTRLATMHATPPTQDDLIYLAVESRRLFQIMGAV
jgi:Swt1-like HEPN